MRQRKYLFNNVNWYSVYDHQKNLLNEEVAKFDGNRILNTSVDDLSEYFEKKYSIRVPELRESEIVADQQETQIDVSHDPNRYIRDKSRPFYVPGITVEITVP